MNTKGIGLGLHISKKIALLFNGDIICRSTFGEGTNFIFLMALSNEMESKQNATRIKNPQGRTYPKLVFKSMKSERNKSDENDQEIGRSQYKSSQNTESDDSFDVAQSAIQIIEES